MTTRRLAAAAIMAIAPVAWSPAGAQQDDYRHAVEAMQDFLEAWVIDYDENTALSYFGAAALETFAPVPAGDADAWINGPGNFIGSGYWLMLNSIWPSGKEAAVDAQLRDVLAVDHDVLSFIRKELSGHVVHEGEFIVFAAWDDVGIHSFDAGYGDVADHLKPSREKPTLTLIAGFRNPKLEAAGPFVSFWGRDDDAAWRIQALGAYPKY